MLSGGRQAHMDLRNHVLDGGLDSLMERSTAGEHIAGILCMCPVFASRDAAITQSIIIGAIRRNAPIRNLFVHFTELHLSTVHNFSSAN